VSARITGVDSASRQPFGTFAPGEYVIWEGRVSGELSPEEEAIPDLDKAARNARGMVEYAARFTLVMPAAPLQGNGALLVDIPNRGRPYAQALYNTPRDEPFLAGTFEQGTGFLQDRGFSTLAIRWELGAWASRSCAMPRTSSSTAPPMPPAPPIR
jgi:hypothetical protein